MEASTVEQCQAVLGYEFQDRGLLKLALTHSSLAPTRLQSNERLEFLGDAVLGFVVCHDLYDRHSELMEGELTKIKSAVVSRQTCAEIVSELGLCQLLRLGKGISIEGLPASIAAGVFESLIGAIYLDGGLEPASAFILEHMRPRIEAVMAEQHQRNYKSILQQHSQRHCSATPLYQLLDEKGPDHSKCFEMSVSINGRHFPSAWGKTKKDAEQEAARLALLDLGAIEEHEEEGEG